MASIIPGYNYDIFISYRQKDNKYDGWVTGFVENLKRELEATFKEEISVYFDINPHDGLLETHDVDASLKEKLKCMIFIPVMSRTYCDPKSFAWVNEFMAFVKQVADDQYGLKVKLPNGNIASRILPVTIHDLDNNDTSLCESVLGGFLRGIEFIYKETGVNRPLTSDDDPKTNLNKTRYRNQVNKVALAIKEIITAIEKPGQQTGEVKAKTGKAASVMESVAEYEKSIAVLPFINDSPDQENTYFVNGVMEEILNNLQKIRVLRVISRTSVEQYRNQTKPITEIARELGVNYILEGSAQRYGNNFRLRTQLILADKETHLWGESFQKNINSVEEIFGIQTQIAESVASVLEAIIAPEEKKLIEKVPTDDLTAYDSYLRGKFYIYMASQDDTTTALHYFEEARDRDPRFALAYAGISIVWLFRQQLGWAAPEEAGPKIVEAVEKALELDSTLADVNYAMATMKVYGMYDLKGGEVAFKKALEINPNHAEAHALFSHLLNMLGRPNEALEHINLALRLDPHNPSIKMWYSQDLLYAHRYDEAISVSRDIYEKNPSMNNAMDCIYHTSHLTGRYYQAFEAIKLLYSKELADLNHVFDRFQELGYAETLNLEADTVLEQSKYRYVPPAFIFDLYTFAGNKERALDQMEKAYDVRDPNVLYIGRPSYTILRDEPRFQELCKKLSIIFPD